MAILVSACCTDAGCAGFGIDRSSVDALAGSDTYIAELCVNDDCDTTDVVPGRSIDFIFFDVNSESVGEMTLTVKTEDSTFTAMSGDIEYTIDHPNGQVCGPTCHLADLTVVDGVIVNA